MLGRKWTLVITVAVLVVGFLIAEVFSSQKEGIKKANSAASKSKAEFITVENKNIDNDFEISGTLSAIKKIEVYSEVAGILLQTPTLFKEGNYFKAGENLIRIDSSVYYNNLMAQKSSFLNELTLLLPDINIDFPDQYNKWESYLAELDLNENLKELPDYKNNKEKYYIAARNIYSMFYTIKGMEATLAKYSLKAPFDGVVTNSDTYPGQLIRANQKLGEFTNTSTFELEASAGLNEIKYIKKGMKVKLVSRDTGDEFDGIVSRINQVIDQTSQTVKVYISSTDKNLRDGMYMSALVSTGGIANAYIISRDLLVNENEVYVLSDNQIELQPVKIEASSNDDIIVTGLRNGTQLLAEKFDGVHEGMEITASELN